MKIKLLKIEQLKKYSLNSKLHPESQIEGIAESIKRYGFTQPVVIDKNNVIVIGHGRVEAARLIGLENIPCIIRDDLSKNDIRALRLIDNRIAETGYDEELLDMELEDLDFDFEEFNISFDEFLMSEDDEDHDDEGSNKPIKKVYKIEIKFTSKKKFNESFDKLKKMGYKCEKLD